MKVTTKGQVTIPQHIRRYLNVSPYSEVDFMIRDETVILVKTNDDKKYKERESKFASLRGIKRNSLTTDQWMESTRGD